jgi:hypothetical protein
LDATFEVPGSNFWDIVLFPFVLADQVVRGAYADALGEQGQTDKKAPEEQAVITEQQVRAGAMKGPQHDPLTDQYLGPQERSKSRYDMNQ